MRRARAGMTVPMPRGANQDTEGTGVMAGQPSLHPDPGLGAAVALNRLSCTGAENGPIDPKTG